MSWGDVGTFIASDGAPWWATIGAPVLTYWIGQRTTERATEKERTAAATEAEAERTAETTRQREQRTEQATQDLINRRVVAFSEAFDSIARLQSEIAKSSIEEYAEPDENGSRTRVINPEHAVDPDALREFVGSVSKLRLFSDDAHLRIDGLVTQINEYVMFWPEVQWRPDPEPLIQALGQLSEDLGGLHTRLSR